MKTKLEMYIEEHDKKLETDPDFAIDYFKSLIFRLSDDVDDAKEVLERLRKNEEIPDYIRHRMDMIRSALNGIDTRVEEVTEIFKKSEEDENKNKEKNNDNDQEKCIRDEQLVNPCGSNSTEGCLPEAEG